MAVALGKKYVKLLMFCLNVVILLFLVDPCKRGTKRARNESSSEKLAKEKPTDPALETAAISEQAETSTNSNEGGAVDYDIESSFNNAVEEAVNTLLALTKQDIHEEKPPESAEAEVERKAEEVEKKQQTINRIRQGWSSEDCGTVSIGELYLMVLLNILFIVKMERIYYLCLHTFSLARMENLF